METLRKSESFVFGPFKDYEENPILKPTKGFQSKRLYNPTVLKEGDTFYMLYRAESDDGLTGSIGFARSDDGIHFLCREEPVLVPGDDFDRGGCEDPRVVKLGETYFLTYVGNSQRYGVSNICLASSKDLVHWKKHGPVMKPRIGAWNSGQMKAGVIVPEKINGRFVMYFMGEERPWSASIGIAVSDDLIEWSELHGDPVVIPRPDRFDSQGVEPGATPVMLEEGILLVYNGWGSDCIYKPGAVLFSKEDPSHVLMRSEEPILVLSKDYGEEFGAGNHCVAEGLVKHGNRWLLYYGAADHVTCLATCEERER